MDKKTVQLCIQLSELEQKLISEGFVFIIWSKQDFFWGESLYIEALDKKIKRFVNDVNVLMPRLSDSSHEATVQSIYNVLVDYHGRIACAYATDAEGKTQLVAMSTLIFKPHIFYKEIMDKFVNLVGEVNEVITKDGYEGKGLGKWTNLKLLDIARRMGCYCVDLTSNPKRERAIAMYQKLGFKLFAASTDPEGKEGTNYFRYIF